MNKASVAIGKCFIGDRDGAFCGLGFSSIYVANVSEYSMPIINQRFLAFSAAVSAPWGIFSHICLVWANVRRKRSVAWRRLPQSALSFYHPCTTYHFSISFKQGARDHVESDPVL